MTIQTDPAPNLGGCAVPTTTADVRIDVAGNPTLHRAHWAVACADNPARPGHEEGPNHRRVCSVDPDPDGGWTVARSWGQVTHHPTWEGALAAFMVDLSGATLARVRHVQAGLGQRRRGR